MGRAPAGPRLHRPALQNPPRPSRPGPVLVRWALPPRVEQVPEVRRRLRTLLDGWHVTGDHEDTLLLVATELASNAVRHAAVLTGRVRVTVSYTGGARPWVRLDVADDHPFRPRALMDTAAESEDGRGLMIVRLLLAELAGVMDVLPAGRGKVVRVDLPVPAPGPAAG